MREYVSNIEEVK